MFFWFIYILPFETSATASCGYTGIHHINFQNALWAGTNSHLMGTNSQTAQRDAEDDDVLHPQTDATEWRAWRAGTAWTATADELYDGGRKVGESEWDFGSEVHPHQKEGWSWDGEIIPIGRVGLKPYWYITVVVRFVSCLDLPRISQIIDSPKILGFKQCKFIVFKEIILSTYLVWVGKTNSPLLPSTKLTASFPPENRAEFPKGHESYSNWIDFQGAFAVSFRECM